MIDKGKIIKELILDDLDGEAWGSLSVYDKLCNGFKGYANFTDDELKVELRERNILTVFGENDD